MNYGIKMLAALDESKNYVFIEDAIPGRDYYCPHCGEVVRCRAKESVLVREHFYHLNKTNCNGGESALHAYWKHHLVNIGDTIVLPLIGQVKCLDRWIEYSTKYNYQPDLIIKTDNPSHKFIVLEILNSNRKDIISYNAIWEIKKYPVFEIDVKRLERDKSNLVDCIKVLYTKEKRNFVSEKRKQVRELRKILEASSLEWEKYEVLWRSLNKVTKLLGTGLNVPNKTNLDIIEDDLKHTYVGKDMYWNFSVPLLKIVQDVRVYKQ